MPDWLAAVGGAARRLLLGGGAEDQSRAIVTVSGACFTPARSSATWFRVNERVTETMSRRLRLETLTRLSGSDPCRLKWANQAYERAGGRGVPPGIVHKAVCTKEGCKFSARDVCCAEITVTQVCGMHVHPANPPLSSPAPAPGQRVGSPWKTAIKAAMVGGT